MSDTDELFAQARLLVVREQRASISHVQRHLQIGYNRAARLLEELEEAGIVSPMNSSGARAVLVRLERSDGSPAIERGEMDGPQTKLRLSDKAEIISLNTRKEGPGDDKALAVDVKFHLTARAQVLSFFDQELAAVLFTDAQAVRNTMIGPIPMLHELQDYRLDMLGDSHFGVKLKKFTIQPLDGARISLTFQASFKPSSTEIATIAEYLQDEIDLVLEPSSEELDFGGKAA